MSGQGLSGAVAGHTFVLWDARLLLDLVRERVQASVLLARTCPLASGGHAAVALRRDSSTPEQGEVLQWSLDLPEATVLSRADRECLLLTAAGVVEELGLSGVAPELLLRGE